MRGTVLMGPRGASLRVEVPETRRERMRGLLGRDGLPAGCAMLLRARSVHTLGMRFPIVTAFLGADLRIVAVRRMRPGRLALPRRHARYVLECSEGIDLRTGDRLSRLANKPWDPP